MIFPLLSVSLIGLAVGALTRRDDLRGGLVRGTVAAWIGFVAGALLGVLIDVILRTGWWVAVLGHAGALLAAVAGPAIRRADRP